jgi:hypothetical protein
MLYIYTVYKFQQKTEGQAIFPNPFTVCLCANGSLSFVHLFTEKQTEVIHLQIDETDLPINVYM